MSTRSEMIEPRHLVDEQLSSLIDTRLEPDERARAEEHLAACDHCRVALDTLRATVGLLRGLPEVASPRSFRLAETARPPLMLRLAPWIRAAGALAASLFVILVSADILGGLGAPAATQQAAPAALSRPTEPAKPAAPAPAGTAAKPAAAAAQNQERAADSAKADGAAPQPAAAAPAAQPAPAKPAAEARPAPSPAAPVAAPPRQAEPASAPESAAAGRTAAPGEPGYVAAGPTPLPTLAPTVTTLPTLAPVAPRGALAESALRPWQVATGLLAAVLLLVSLVLPRLARRLSPGRTGR